MNLTNVHIGLPLPIECAECYMIDGAYEYYHYGIDGVSDQGWGCGYRSLQTIISWFIKTHSTPLEVPSIKSIQELLVTKAGDKEDSFINSKEWIGSFEIFLILDILLQVQCKILYISKGESLHLYIDQLIQHFKECASPVMMGGDIDCSSKCILGVARNNKKDKIFLLVLDPHYTHDAGEYSSERLQNDKFIRWMSLAEFDQRSFYNLCFPIVNHGMTA